MNPSLITKIKCVNKHTYINSELTIPFRVWKNGLVVMSSFSPSIGHQILFLTYVLNDLQLLVTVATWTISPWHIHVDTQRQTHMGWLQIK